MAGGELEVATSGGNIGVAGSAGDARLATSGGDITLEEAGGHVSAESSGGDLRVTLAPGNDRGAELSTEGGLLLVRLPAGVGFEVDADAPGGRIRADVPIQARGVIREDRIQGTIGGGGSLLRLRNEDGDIRIEGPGR